MSNKALLSSFDTVKKRFTDMINESVVVIHNTCADDKNTNS